MLPAVVDGGEGFDLSQVPDVVPYEEIGPEVIEWFAGQYGDRSAAEPVLVRANAIFASSRTGRVAERLSLGQLPDLDRAGASRFWEAAFSVAGSLGARMVASLVLAPTEPVDGVRAAAFRELESAIRPEERKLRLSWIHIVDPEVTNGTLLTGEDVQQEWQDDVRALASAEDIPWWDLVVVSGKLTQADRTPEVDSLLWVVDLLKRRLQSLGSNPDFLGVPDDRENILNGAQRDGGVREFQTARRRQGFTVGLENIHPASRAERSPRNSSDVLIVATDRTDVEADLLLTRQKGAGSPTILSRAEQAWCVHTPPFAAPGAVRGYSAGIIERANDGRLRARIFERFLSKHAEPTTRSPSRHTVYFSEAPTIDTADAISPPPAAPAGVTHERSFAITDDAVTWMRWSPSAQDLAIGTSSSEMLTLRPGDVNPVGWRSKTPGAVEDIGWSDNGAYVAAVTLDGLVIRDAHGAVVQELPVGGSCLAWSSTSLVVGSTDRKVLRLPSPREDPDVLFEQQSAPTSLGFSRDGTQLAVTSRFGLNVRETASHKVEYVETRALIRSFESTPEDLTSRDCDFSPDTHCLAKASDQPRVVVVAALHWPSWHALQYHFLDHDDAVNAVSFSSDGRLLVTTTRDGVVHFWRTRDWTKVGQLNEAVGRTWLSGAAVASDDRLATVCDGGRNVRVWRMDLDALLGDEATTSTVRTTSAKVVLLGEGSVGKTCLATRICEDTYPEDPGSTLGMKLFTVPVSRLAEAEAEDEDAEQRELVFWDLGGQSEYRLIHRLFMKNTNLALVLVEPRRDSSAAEAERWNAELDQQIGGTFARLLVGSKLDDAAAPARREEMEALAQRLGCVAYLPSSAKIPRGIPELNAAILEQIPWETLSTVSHSHLLDAVTDAVDRMRTEGRTYVTLDALRRELERDDVDFSPRDLPATLVHLEREGRLARARMQNGADAIVLRLEDVERYASSVIVAARENPRGVPAVDYAFLLSEGVHLPRMKPEDRLDHVDELVLLQCVMELFIENGLCFRHGGRYIFPALFPDDGPHEDPAGRQVARLHYTLPGDQDYLYAQLVVALAHSGSFGAPSLSTNRAEFRSAAGGLLGVARRPAPNGADPSVALLEIYCSPETSEAHANLLRELVHNHLVDQGVAVDAVPQTITCDACGYQLAYDDILFQMQSGQSRIGCRCMKQHAIFPIREEGTQEPIVALLERAREAKQRDQAHSQRAFAQVMSQPKNESTIDLLHLSDLHVFEKDDPLTLAQPLLADLRDPEDGFGLKRLDYIVVTGDITNIASPGEFETARKFLEILMEETGVSAERCVVVPGNHDLSWDVDVYDFLKARKVTDKQKRDKARVVESGSGYLVRDDDAYPKRFENFANFHNELLLRPYPLDPKEQGSLLPFPDHGLQIIGLNSAWEIDEEFKGRSGIQVDAMTRVLAQLEKTQPDDGGKWLRIAAWHHPVMDAEGCMKDDFMTQLQKQDVRVCLHGHVHEERAELFGYLHPTRKIRLAGAGSFGAGAKERPANAPKQYNLLRIQRDRSSVTVHTRHRKKDDGSWGPWYAWPKKEGGLQDFYVIEP